MSESSREDAPLIAGLRADGIARHHLAASARLKVRCAEELAPSIDAAGLALLQALRRGRKALVFGNGGSAADAQHLASELTGRFIRHRRALPAIALTTDTSALTAISNDYGFDQVYARQVEALAREGDVVVGLSTSGTSASVIRALEVARNLGCITIGLTGRTGGEMPPLCDHFLVVPSDETALIQEVHESIIHSWGTLIEGWYLDNPDE